MNKIELLIIGLIIVMVLIDTIFYFIKKNKKTMWELLIPAGINNKEFTAEQHKVWENDVTKSVGEITIIRQLKGDWLTSNKLEFKDRVLRVNVVCNEKQLKKIIQITMLLYHMEKIIVYKTGEDVIILD